MHSHMGIDIKRFHLCKCLQDLWCGPAGQSQIMGFLQRKQEGSTTATRPSLKRGVVEDVAVPLPGKRGSHTPSRDSAGSAAQGLALYGLPSLL